MRLKTPSTRSSESQNYTIKFNSVIDSTTKLFLDGNVCTLSALFVSLNYNKVNSM